MPSPQVRHSLAKMCNNLLGFYALFLLCPPAPFHEHENVAAHAHAGVCAGAGLVGTDYYATKPSLRVPACQPRDSAHFLPKKANLRNIAQCIRLVLIPVSKARTHV